MLFMVLVVCLIMVMFLWLLSLLGAVPGLAERSGWLVFFACLILCAIVLGLGTGVVVWTRGP